MITPQPSFFKKHWKLIVGVVAVLAIIGAIQEALKKEVPPPPQLQQTTSSDAAPATPVPTTTSNAAKELEQFNATLKDVDKTGSLVKKAEIGRTPDTLNVIVADRWHYEPYQMRLQMGQAMWKLWAAIHSPSEPDKARLSLRDGMGNEVGGSRVFGGSLIWVQEN